LLLIDCIDMIRWSFI